MQNNGVAKDEQKATEKLEKGKQETEKLEKGKQDTEKLGKGKREKVKLEKGKQNKEDQRKERPHTENYAQDENILFSKKDDGKRAKDKEFMSCKVKETARRQVFRKRCELYMYI